VVNQYGWDKSSDGDLTVDTAQDTEWYFDMFEALMGVGAGRALYTDLDVIMNLDGSTPMSRR